ncbi:hypothetical protein [Paenibacillus sp. Soil766]
MSKYGIKTILGTPTFTSTTYMDKYFIKRERQHNGADECCK